MSKGNIAIEKTTVLPSGACWRVNPPWFLSVGAIGRFLVLCLRKDLIAVHVMAFLLGRVSIVGELMPLGLAFFIAVATKQRAGALSVGAFTLAGSLSIGYPLEAAWYLLLMAAYLGLLRHETRWQKKIGTSLIITAAGMALAGVTLLFWQVITLYQLLLVGFTLAVSLVLAAIFSHALPLLSLSRYQQANAEQVMCLVVLLASAITGVGQIQLAGYSLHSVVSGFFIMLLTSQSGIGMGVSVGTMLGIIAGLSAGGTAHSVAYYAVASLVCGIFSSRGKLAIALGYMLGGVIAIAYFAANEQMLSALIEAGAGALLFLAIPAGWWTLGEKKTNQAESAAVNPDQAITSAAQKLSQIAEIFGDLSGVFDQAATTAVDSSEEVRQMINRLGTQVCKTCPQCSTCWESQFYSTYQAFLDLMSLPSHVKLNSQSLPKFLKDSCQRQPLLLTAAADILEHNREKVFWQVRAKEHRIMLAEQMRSVGSMLDLLTTEIQNVPLRDKHIERCLSTVTRAAGCALDSVKVTGHDGSLRIEACKDPCGGEQECITKVMPLVAEALGKRLAVTGECGSKTMRRKCRLTLSAAACYSIEVGAASIAKSLHDVSGDTCSVAEAGQGRVAAIISDGMGSGADAAHESQAAVQTLEKLLAADFSVAAAVKSVNAMLLLRLPGECYATIDVAVFDLYSGEVEFLKTGSAVSYIKRVREISVVQSSSLPVGIIEQVEIEPQKRKLVPGDTVVMISDGVVEADRQKPRRDWIANFLRMAPDDDPQQLANLLIDQARKLSGATVNDDMTVLVIKVHDRLGMSR